MQRLEAKNPPRSNGILNAKEEKAAVRVVLLGASNLTLGLPLVLHALEQGLDGDLEVLVAAGHGRSYGMRSRFLFYRTLPGITECGLWAALNAPGADRSRTLALLTDVGNDLVYGAGVEQLIGWLETCLERLAEHGAEAVLTLLPMAGLQQLPRWRFSLLRTIFFPFHGASQAVVMDRAQALDEQMRALAQRTRARTVEPPADWYGFDPIHIRRSRQISAWRAFLSKWESWNHSVSIARPGWRRCLRAWRLRPAERWLWRWYRETPQPASRSERMTVSLY